MSYKSEKYKKTLEGLIAIMDSKEEVKRIILDIIRRGDEIPEKYRHVDVTEPHWRKTPGVLRRLKKTARIIINND